MNLALLQVPVPVFQEIRDHLLTHKPPYRNMHLRQMIPATGELRYLHALFAPRGTTAIHGMISGPDVFWTYQATMASATRIHLQVVPHRTNRRAEARIFRRFLPEIANRIEMERAGNNFPPNRVAGRFYLQRSRPGMHASHRNCVAAVQARQLDQTFVDQLHAWDLEVLHP